jgi:hypothetical protein
MEEQPVPRNDQWPWSTALWGIPKMDARNFGSVRVVYGIRECCTQCGEMIFADKVACVVTVEHGQKWLRLHFHRACYLAWERTEHNPPAAPPGRVVEFPARQQFTDASKAGAEPDKG